MFDSIAERRIAEAIERGELDDLPGAGRPLELDDDPLVPEDMRMAHRILKNAGYSPFEPLAGEAPEDRRLRVLKKIALLRTAAESRAGRRPASTSRRRG